MLALLEDVRCTVLAGADGATKAVGLLETDSVFCLYLFGTKFLSLAQSRERAESRHALWMITGRLMELIACLMLVCWHMLQVHCQSLF